MSRSSSVLRALCLGSVFVAGTVHSQQSLQSLKDTWVATSARLYQVDYNLVAGGGLVLKNPGDGPRSFQALAFELPTLGYNVPSARNLIAVDGTKLVRFAEGTNDAPATVLFDAGNAPASLKSVTAIAVTSSGLVLFSGYSKPKRVFELWALDPALAASDPQRITLKVTGSPQLTDIVYVPPEDVAAGSLLTGGGLLAAGGREALFFPQSQNYLTFFTLFDARNLNVKGNTQLTSLDLVRKTDSLMIATSERTLLTTGVALGAVTKFADVPDIAGRGCASIKPQRLLVRNARSGDGATSIVADVCGQVLRYDFASASSTANLPSDTDVGDPLVALAVGEGNEIVCPANVRCTLTRGFDVDIESSSDSQLLVQQIVNACDRRIQGSTCTAGEVLTGNYLSLNSLLPPSIRQQLAANGVLIKIPPYMFGAGPNGEFGVLLVQADANTASSYVTARLDLEQLTGTELGVRLDFPRTTPTLDILNQDIAAYAPDNPRFPTVRDFEAMPVTTGMINPMFGSLRGFSAVIFGLQHDLNPAGPRAPTGGLPANTPLTYGAPPRCNLVQGSQQFVAGSNPAAYFVNLAACVFADQETLLSTVIPNAAFVLSNGRSSLQSQLGLVNDKLIKALNAAGPSTGSENLQAVLSQLDHYDQALLASVFAPQYIIYRNELIARSKVFRFNLLSRTYPSLPSSGF